MSQKISSIPSMGVPSSIAKLLALLEITKPKVVLMLVFTAWVGMVLVPAESFHWPVMIYALIGIGLASASGAALNHLMDERIDAQMARTGKRPLPSGRLSPHEVLLYGYFVGRFWYWIISMAS